MLSCVPVCRETLVCGLFGGLAVGKSSLIKARSHAGLKVGLTTSQPVLWGVLVLSECPAALPSSI